MINGTKYNDNFCTISPFYVRIDGLYCLLKYLRNLSIV